MSTLSGKPVANTYKDLLTVFDGDQNEGIESSLKTVRDGEGVETAIQLSTTTLKIPSGKTLEIAGTLNSVNATLTGDLAVGDDLTVTDLISGARMDVSGTIVAGGNIQSSAKLIAQDNIETQSAIDAGSAIIGGGYGSTGATISSAGNIQTNGTITSDDRIVADNVQIGGGSGNSGTTIDASGNVLTDSRVTCNDMHIGGGFVSSGSGSGLSISQDGRIDTNDIIVCEAVKTTGGVVSSSASNSPKVKLDNTSKISLTVDDSGTDKEILKVEEDGEATFKSKAGDTKFVVKDTGVLKYKAKTTAELTAIKNAGNAVAGDIAYDSVKGFVVYVP